MSKVSVEIKDDEKTTIYTADFTVVEAVAKSVADNVGSFLKSTFKREVFVKQVKKD